MTDKDVTIIYNESTGWLRVDVDGQVHESNAGDKTVELQADVEEVPDGYDIDPKTGYWYRRCKPGQVTYTLAIRGETVFTTHEHPARRVDEDIVTYIWQAQAPAGGVGGMQSLVA